MNSVFLIFPYQYKGKWVFDDAKVGLHREPFIGGADTLISRLSANIPGADKGFCLLFSASPFPDFQAKLEWRREDFGGNVYYCPQFEMEGWLCPALYRYFDETPKEIYAKAEAESS